jgi:hypothetical protein
VTRSRRTQSTATHGVTAAQVMLAWHLQQGRSAIPKSVKPERIGVSARQEFLDSHPALGGRHEGVKTVVGLPVDAGTSSGC